MLNQSNFNVTITSLRVYNLPQVQTTKFNSDKLYIQIIFLYLRMTFHSSSFFSFSVATETGFSNIFVFGNLRTFATSHLCFNISKYKIVKSPFLCSCFFVVFFFSFFRYFFLFQRPAYGNKCGE